MSGITSWIIAHGVTEEILLMLLFVPIIATLVNFSRYVVGLKTLGIYAPMILAFAYIFTGIRFGLLVTVGVIVASLLSYSVFKRVRMHYISRTTVNYILIAFFVILILVLNEISPIKITSDNHNAQTLPPLGIILITTLSDFFIKQYVKNNFVSSLRSLVETVIIGFLGWAVLNSVTIQNFVLTNLWIQPVLLILNLTLGKYTGMRLKEFLRFKHLLKND